MSGGRDEIHSLEELRAWVQRLKTELPERAVVLLSGPLGAGKTQLIRFLAEEFGCEDVASPSFAIHHRYDARSCTIDHVDLYRVENEEDLESTGFWDLFAKTSGYIVIEWADRLEADILPPNWPQVSIRIESDEDWTQRRWIQVAMGP